MAQKVTVELADDLDGGPADEAVCFGFDGTEYEIDLSQKNARAFRAQLAPRPCRIFASGPVQRAERDTSADRPFGLIVRSGQFWRAAL